MTTQDKRILLNGYCLVLSVNNNEEKPYYLISKKKFNSQKKIFKLNDQKGFLKPTQQTKSMDYGGGNGWDCWKEDHWLTGKHKLPFLLNQLNILSKDSSVEEYNNIIKKYVLSNKPDNNVFLAWNSKNNTWVEIRYSNKRLPERISDSDKDTIIKKLKKEIIDSKTIFCENCETQITDTNYLNIDENTNFYCNKCYYD